MPTRERTPPLCFVRLAELFFGLGFGLMGLGQIWPRGWMLAVLGCGDRGVDGSKCEDKGWSVLVSLVAEAQFLNRICVRYCNFRCWILDLRGECSAWRLRIWMIRIWEILFRLNNEKKNCMLRPCIADITENYNYNIADSWLYTFTLRKGSVNYEVNYRDLYRLVSNTGILTVDIAHVYMTWPAECCQTDWFEVKHGRFVESDTSKCISGGIIYYW